MNYRVVGFILAWVFRVVGMLMLLPCLIALVYRESEGWIYLLLALIALAAGSLMSMWKPKNMAIYQKEGYIAVGLSWLLMGAYGAIPFVLTGEIPFYIDALFEIVSGFTTTGSSILTDVEALSHVSLFWRSFSHWIGGMGVLVFILMMIPSGNGGSHMNLMKAESPGPDVSKFVPRVRNTAMILYRIYLIMTIMEIAILLLSGMHWFDTLCLTFGSAGTGGFGILNTSVASYTPLQQWIITIFITAFGVNFSFYYLILTKKYLDAFRMEEVRTYLLIVLAAGLVIMWDLRGMYRTIEETARASFFQVASIITTTGFSTVDFNQWPAVSKTVLVALMVIGACAGSTGGGVKVSRVIIVFKSIKEELHTLVHPRSVRHLRMDGHVIPEKTVRSTYVFFITYFLIFALSILLISFNGFSFETNFTAVCATLNNIGPGLDMVGPAANFSLFHPLAKVVLIFDMLAGRLELLPMLIVFYPGAWKKH